MKNINSRKYYNAIYIFIIILLCGCGSTSTSEKKREVTHEALETIRNEIFSNFRFNLSKDIILREIVILGEHMEQIGPGTISVSNEEIHIRRSIIGRFQKEVPPNKIEIYFEELPDGKRPVLNFIQNVTADNERYYIETTFGEGYVVDETGKYGYIKISGDIVSYNGLQYFLYYTGDEKPYLIQELDVNVIQERHEIQGF